MEIRIKETGAVMYEHELRALYPNVSGPLDSLYDVILEGPQATPPDFYGFSQRAGVEEVNGQWFTKYVVGPVFTGPNAGEQEAAYKARIDDERKVSNKDAASRQLAASDYLVAPDAAAMIANGEEIVAYRAALRAIALDPPVTVPAWPVKPATQWMTGG